ncbi:MAG: serine hydrolase [Planctomycetes bacterium]|nr:serine hydrolase [Planctomycetota bacterium]
MPLHPFPLRLAIGLLSLGTAVSQTAATGGVAARLEASMVAALVQRAHEKFLPKGLAVAVVQDGVVLGEFVHGERRDGAPVTAITLFNIASCSKAFTAALLAQLVSEHRLAWNDPVVERLPEFRLADPWITAHMTLADLLSHRCGLKTFAGDLLWYGTSYPEAEVLARMAKLPITQRFREEFGYQNLMYMAAGMVLQRATGQSWEDLLEERLLRPLGMNDSRACAQRLPADAEIALPHIDGKPVPDHLFSAAKAAASMYSSVRELTAWIRMLLANGRWQDQALLAPPALAEMWRPHVGIGSGSGATTDDLRGYGMGWFLYVENGKKLVEHDGGMPGFLSKVSLLPADGFGFVVLNNANDGIVNEAIKRALLVARNGGNGAAEIDRLATVAERIHARDRAAAAKREAARQPGTTPSLPLPAYAGRYRDAILGDAEVAFADGQLQVALLPARERMHGPLQHWHHDGFRCDFPDRFLPFALFRFELDSDGKVAGFRIDCPIADFDFGALDFRRVDERR